MISQENIQRESIDIIEEEIPEIRQEGKTHSSVYEKFLKELSEQPNLDTKLQFAVDFMEQSLKSKTPHFKSFWDAKKKCLDLFKEEISSSVRMLQWSRYSSLSQEARRLKEIFDEESGFASEQIEKAIESVLQDLEHFEQKAEKLTPFDQESFPKALHNHKKEYETLQKKLNLLNAYAARINSLRKELIKTDLKIKQKNRLFQQLSKLGDQIFPLRKELIKDISDLFIADINDFAENNFGQNELANPLFYVREQIKILQNFAKLVTLNTNTFTQTRLLLSECWDKVKEIDKERKQERLEKKKIFQQNAEIFRDKIKQVHLSIESNEINEVEALKNLDMILGEMRKSELDRENLIPLREEIQSIKRPIEERFRSEEENRLNQEKEKEKAKREKVKEVRTQIEQLLQNVDAYDAEGLVAERDRILKEISETMISKLEKIELEKMLKPLKDTIAERKEKAILCLSETDQQTLQKLKDLLRERKERRQEIKEQIEILRKLAGSSGLDIQKAWDVDKQLKDEKERFDKANQGVREIEAKIQEIEDS